MNFNIGDKVDIVSGHLSGLGGKIVDVFQGLFLGEDTHCLVVYGVDKKGNNRKYWINEKNLRLVVAVASKEVLSKYPHICPNCGHRAYIGFMGKVDCSAKCNEV